MNNSRKVIKHIGTPRHSGRYPWGSGGNSEQRGTSFLGFIKELLDKGMTEKEVAKSMGMTMNELRHRKTIAKNAQRASDVAMALRLKDKGMSKSAIGRRMNKNESTIRSLLDPILQARANIINSISNLLRSVVSEKGVVDVGSGVETNLGITRTKLDTSLQMLKDEGYNVYFLKTEQLGTGKFTSIRVLAPPGMSYSDVYKNRDKIQTVTEHSVDGGRSFLGLDPVQNISSNRIKVSYKGEGGEAKDGVIELRRGVSDLSLGNSNYAQVRIAVDGTHYLKGMAIYSDNMPPGIDVIYNTKKDPGTPKEKVFKEMAIDETTGKVDTDNPFGATIKKGGQRGALNIINEQGDWKTWNDAISSQVLSKQSPALAKKQLELGAGLKKDEFEEIMSLTNPALKQHMLNAFADDCDSSAIHLQAAKLPRQSNHVLLPIPEMNSKEVYAPMYNNGERVVLIRHPHGGKFEIPELVVNNKLPIARKIIGNAPDAIGINPDVAAKLSGADFDGDHVLVIPNDKGSIKTAPSLKGLSNFDPIESYPPYDGMKRMTKPGKGLEMGNISNLITDMTIQGATSDELARAVRHSMVVIDAEKHELNWKQSAIDNNIAQLKEKYQQGSKKGAATLISRSKSQERVPHRKDTFKIDPETGEKIYSYTGETYVNKEGKVIKRETISTKMAEAKDAFDLSSGTKMEAVYAQHANDLKALANKARKEAVNTPNLERSPTATRTYAKEVDSLNTKLKLAYSNRPLERQAQLFANAVYRAKLQANRDLDPSQKKRLKGQALIEGRRRMGAKKPLIEILPNEWQAIQAGALSHSKVKEILRNTDLDIVKQKATPRTAYKMTPLKVSRAKAMAAAGYTPAEIASALGVSATTIVTTLE